MSESTKNLLNINHLSDKLCNLENFLDFKWDSYAVPIIDVDFFDLFSRLVINQEVFEFSYELSKKEIEKLINSGDVTDRLELDKLNKSLLRVEALEFEDYLSQNTLAIFKNPEYYINRLDESTLHTPLNNNNLKTNLNSINLKNKKILNENGSANLYLTFGFYTSDEYNAPLIFIPVKLELDEDEFKLSYSSHDKIRLNTSLELKLNENKIELPHKEIKSETDMISYLTEVNKLGDVKPFITLGLFDFTTSLAFNDLNKFEESEELGDILNGYDKTIHFNESEIDSIDENDSHNIFDADSSQISAIREALLDGDLFIDAPAGSKKIETIINLVSEIIANKKTVLYVSDKLSEIRQTEERLSEIGLENVFLDLYGDNYNYQSLIGEITNTSEYVPKFDYNKEYTDSRLNELNDVKGKLASYSNFISTPYKNTGLTPYHLMGVMETEYSDELDEFGMKNLSDLTNEEYVKITKDFGNLSDLYVNKIHPVAKHGFNYIAAKDISDEDVAEIITTIPNLKSDLEELIKLNNEINKKFGVKKLEKLNDYESHFAKLEAIENNPQIMADDYEVLKKYVDSLENFQNKTNEYGSIDDLEKLLLVEVYNTQLDLENQFEELNKLNEDITKLNDLLDEFRLKVSQANIKKLNSIAEIEDITDSLDLLDKNPSIVSDEDELDIFVDDVDKYQKECETNTPEELLTNINEYSKSTLTSTRKDVNELIGYQESISEVNAAINDLNDLKEDIGLNEFKSINNLKEDLKKSDILLTSPILVDDEKAIDEFIDFFKTGANKFAGKDYDAFYSQMNDEIGEIQNNISDEISKTNVLETNIPTIKNELTSISENTKKLSELLNIKEIDSLKEVDELCDNVEILLKNPIIIESGDKNKIDGYITLLEDIKNNERYTRLNLDKVNEVIKKVIRFNRKLEETHFDYNVFRYVGLKKQSDKISDCESKLYASPINPTLTYDFLENKFAIFAKEHNKLLKSFSGDYKKIKKELRSYYRYDAPRDDEIIYADFKNHLGILKEIEDIKKPVLNYNNLNKSMTLDEFKAALDQLIELEKEFNDIEKELSSLLPNLNYDNALDSLVPIKLKLSDIDVLRNDENSTVKFRRGVDVNSDKQNYINSQLKKYFPKSYFKLETNLDDLYQEYALNEEYRELLDNKFFSNDSLNKCNANKNEIKTILNNIKQSKSKVYYYLNLIGNNIEITETSMDLRVISETSFNDLIKYFDDLFGEINKANDLFNGVNENYKIDDIEKIIENYSELNNFDNIKEFITTTTYEKTLVEYRDNFKLLNEFTSMGDDYSSLIDKYFPTVWKDRLTSLDELNETFENHKFFTKLLNEEFFSQNVFTFLERPDDEIKSKIQELSSKCDEISQKTSKFDGQLVFYGCDLKEISFEEYMTKNTAALDTIELLKDYDLTFNNYDENNLIDLNEKANFESIETVNQLYKDLNKLYNDSEVLKYDISFESEIDNLNKITENKNRFIDLVRLRNSIENQTELIDNHFDKLWNGATTDISIIKNKVEIDKEFTKEYNAGVFSDKTVELINEDEHSFDNYKNEFMAKFDEIKIQINKISSNRIIINEFENELQNTEFDLISQKTSEIQKDINSLDSNYNNIKISKTFDLDEISSDVNILDEIIQSKYIKHLGENLDNLNNSNDKLKSTLDKRNELQSIKDDFDGIDVDSKYFKDIYSGYDTSVDELNQQLEYNNTYEELFNEGFFSNKTNKILKDESKLKELGELSSKMKTYIENSISSFRTLDLIHTEKEININKSLDEALVYATFFDDNTDQLKDWIAFERESKNLDNDVCHEFIEAFYKDGINLELINQSFSYNFARNLIEEIKQDYNFISKADIDNYVILDKEVIELNRLRVLDDYINSRPDFENMESQDSKIMKQYKAYTKFDDLSLKNDGDIEKLLDESIDYIKAIKPVFITTPSSVFKYLSSCDFDYIIFDDVNQISPELGITTLLRANKKVIVGDSKQSNIGLTSLMKDKFKTKSLKWCYDLKNISFYDEDILNYPEQDGESTFEIVNVENSVYDISSQINEAEAEKIVDLAIEHVNEYGFDKTLGIIAFTKEQRDYIIKLLLERIEDSPDLVQYFNPLDSFYVKYIDDAYESRDIILASLTHGLDDDNILNIDFESENEYIFNKLMTKSFEKTIVLVNFKLDDIVEDNNVKSLFEYQNDETKEFELSLFEENVYNFLNNNDFKVKKQLVDFTIDDEISIECEGENFNEFEDVRDKFRLHANLLESRGWKSLHICAADWIDNRTEYQNNLLDAINADVEFDEDISIDDEFEFDFETDDEISINELKELL